MRKDDFPSESDYVQACVNFGLTLVVNASWISYLVLYIFFLPNFYAALVILFLGLPTSLSGLYLIKWRRQYNKGAFVYLAGGVLTLGILACLVGGAYSPAIAWLMFGIITAFLCARPKQAFFIVGIAVLSQIAASLGSIFGWIKGTGFSFPVESLEFQYFIMVVNSTAMIAQAIITIIYNRIVRGAYDRAEQARRSELEKNQDIRAILKNISTGILTITADGNLYRDFSDRLTKILGYELEVNQPALPQIFRHLEITADERQKAEMVILSCMKEQGFTFYLNEHCLPRQGRLKRPDGLRHLEIDWDPIFDSDGFVQKVLVSLKDVTDDRMLQQKSAESQETLELVRELLEVDRNLFSHVLDSAMSITREHIAILKKKLTLDPEISRSFFINIHTIKGNARSLMLSRVVAACHEIEESLANLRDAKNLTPDTGKRLLELHEILQQTCHRYHDVAMEKLHFELHDKTIRLNKNEVTRLVEASFVNDHRAAPSLVRLLADHVYISQTALLEEMRAIMRRTALDVDKPLPSLQAKIQTLYFTDRGAATMRKIMIHLIRNALDHGIESSSERLAAGKSPEGCIRMEMEVRASHLNIILQDDGRGLAIGKIRNKALASGHGHRDSPISAFAELIFQDGFSTATTVSDISGRGVGMGAIRRFVEAEGGRFQLTVQDAPSDAAYVPFSIQIELPAGLWLVLPHESQTPLSPPKCFAT